MSDDQLTIEDQLRTQLEMWRCTANERAAACMRAVDVIENLQSAIRAASDDNDALRQRYNKLVDRHNEFVQQSWQEKAKLRAEVTSLIIFNDLSRVRDPWLEVEKFAHGDTMVAVKPFPSVADLQRLVDECVSQFGNGDWRYVYYDDEFRRDRRKWVCVFYFKNKRDAVLFKTSLNTGE
ncbi:hypothetical protein [Paracraurococcus lichenis]|uniref:Uncharacterized protein n=1 Tax=Paracraurococcus lichenis TaxID=3064888 RepID=A0ABT9E741_9PROT|nr:hypothetical protein [Paracraurococcus sp. LOR1-02]MDO9711994.1 hypothetical protein [Paracraurococcus sp. LOR1-02]